MGEYYIYKLFFVDSKYKSICINENIQSEEEVVEEIQKFCKEQGYLLPFLKSWTDDRDYMPIVYYFDRIEFFELRKYELCESCSKMKDECICVKSEQID